MNMATKKNMKPDAASQEAQFHNKHRPRTLDRVIGQEAAVKRLQGIIDSKRYPSTMLFQGPPSAGKTTLGRAFAAGVMGVKNIKNHPDFHELNCAAEGNIDNIRNLLRLSRLRPRQGPRRIFMLDECHGLTGASLEALLKPLEEPPPFTLWIMGTSEPEKLKAAMKQRGSVFSLGPQSRENMLKYAKRIIKAEDMSYMTDALIETAVENANGEMRTLCQILEAVIQTAGNSKKVSEADINKSLSTIETDDAKVAMNVLYETYSGNMEGVYRHLLDVNDGFRMVSLLLQFNSFLINAKVLKGEKHRSVWWNKNNKDLHEAMKELKVSLKDMSLVQHHLLQARAQSGAFMVTEQQLLGNALFFATSALQRKKEKK